MPLTIKPITKKFILKRISNNYSVQDSILIIIHLNCSEPN
jgi:hypothetical protein